MGGARRSQFARPFLVPGPCLGRCLIIGSPTRGRLPRRPRRSSWACRTPRSPDRAPVSFCSCLACWSRPSREVPRPRAPGGPGPARGGGSRGRGFSLREAPQGDPRPSPLSRASIRGSRSHYRVSERPLLWRAAGVSSSAIPWKAREWKPSGRAVPGSHEGGEPPVRRRATILAAPTSRPSRRRERPGPSLICILRRLARRSGALPGAREKDALVAGSGVAVVPSLPLSLSDPTGSPPTSPSSSSSWRPSFPAPFPARTAQGPGGGCGVPSAEKYILSSSCSSTRSRPRSPSGRLRAPRKLSATPRRIGFHEEEIGPGGPFRRTRRRFALSAEPGRDAPHSPRGLPAKSELVDLDVTVEGRAGLPASAQGGRIDNAALEPFPRAAAGVSLQRVS